MNETQKTLFNDFVMYNKNIVKWSVKYGHIELIKWLYGVCGDNLNLGYTDFQSATSNGRLEVVKWLCEHKIVTAKSYLETAIRCAEINGHIEVIKYIKEQTKRKA